MAFNISYNFTALDKFSGPVKKINAATRKVQDRMKSLNKTLGKTGNKFSNVTKGMLKFKNVLRGGLGAAGLFLAFKKIVSSGTTFEDTLADLSAITGITGKQLDSLAKSAKIMSVETVTASSDVVNAFKLVASAKSDLIAVEGGLETVTRQAILLKNAAGIPLQDSVDALTISLNQFQAPAKDAAKFVNILAAGSKVGASEIFETSSAIVKSGAAAKLANINFAELNASIQVLAKNGIKGQLAGTQLKTALIKLTALGIDKISPKVVGLNQALFNLQKANLDAAQLTKLFGLESLAAGSILIENAKLVKDWTKAISGTNVAQEQAAIRMGTFSVRLRRIGFEIQNKLIETFLRLEPKLIEMTQAFKGFLDSIGTEQIDALVDGLKAVLEITILVARALGAVGKGVGLLRRSGSEFAFQASGNTERRGIFGQIAPENQPPQITPVKIPGSDRSSSDINVNINAPDGVVRSVTAKSKGPTKFNLGQNGGLSAVGAF